MKIIKLIAVILEALKCPFCLTQSIEGAISRLICEILLKTDRQNHCEAENWIKKAIDSDKTNGTMFQLGRDYAVYADLFKCTGAKSKAVDHLNAAIDTMKECCADKWVNKFEKEMETLL